MAEAADGADVAWNGEVMMSTVNYELEGRVAVLAVQYEQVGLDRIYEAALDAAQRNGARWGSGRLLERLAREGKRWKDA